MVDVLVPIIRHSLTEMLTNTSIWSVSWVATTSLEAQAAAAVRIQARLRGRQGRAAAADKAGEKKSEEEAEEDEYSEEEEDYEEEDEEEEEEAVEDEDEIGEEEERDDGTVEVDEEVDGQSELELVWENDGTPVKTVPKAKQRRVIGEFSAAGAGVRAVAALASGAEHGVEFSPNARPGASGPANAGAAAEDGAAVSGGAEVPNLRVPSESPSEDDDVQEEGGSESETEEVDMAVGDGDVEDEEEGYSFTPDSEPPPVASE